jgi:hypothetical protein
VADPADAATGLGAARYGAYGLALDVELDPALLVAVPAQWPTWTVRVHARAYEPRAGDLGNPDRILLPLRPDGFAVLSRPEQRTDVYHPVPSPHGLAHPYLASTGVGVSPWLGRTTFHASAFVLDGGVWGVLADRDQGKTSVLAWMGLHGHPVFTDDVLVVDAEVAYAGPRLLDLRQSAAEHFGVGDYLGVVGTRERWRVYQPPVEAALPLRGWITLGWDDDISVEACSAEERSAVLAANKGLLVPETDPLLWFALLGRPLLRLRRPRDWSQVDVSMHALLDAVHRRV